MESASISIYNQKGGVNCRLLSREYVSGHGMELLGLVMRVVKRLLSGLQHAAFSDGSDQQNAGDGNPQGSPLGRFTWPCGFSSPVFNFLPAENYMNNRLLCEFEDTIEFLAQYRHILSDPIIGDAGIDLGRGDPFMSQHLADGFQRYALRKRNRRAKVCRMFATCRKDMFIVL